MVLAVNAISLSFHSAILILTLLLILILFFYGFGKDHKPNPIVGMGLFMDGDGIPLAFITTQSVKKLKKHIKQWALESTGWHLVGINELFDITLLEQDEKTYEKYKLDTFYKERWIKEDGLEQKLIVTYSLKYRDYHRKIRSKQLERAATDNLVSGTIVF